ncbi:MAG: class I mannose-6-phosphate isomerase [Tannerella sp.]|jgi:mannose-6-phosphate isomerase|nr:class I mannose-6-phosphate isomerase [Tannerella sp.]
MYPFIFEPILKEIIWGGKDIRLFKGLPPGDDKIGESWELSHVEGNCSVVANGASAGQTIDDLVENFGAALLGKKVLQQFGKRFPLLIKFIDAQDDLSIQVHPDDELAQKRHHSFGKTEMWYVIKATRGAALYSGFSRRINADEYMRYIANNSFTDVLHRYEVTAGDVFFLPAGRVHAIGAGCFIAEIQQTSNITYRIYDYNRRDANGNARELHVEQAKDAIDYTPYPDCRTSYVPAENRPVELVRCKYFTTCLLSVDKAMKRDFASLDSFVVHILTEGSAVIRDDCGNELSVRQGQTILIPAATQWVEIIPSPHAKLLETCVR